MRQSAVFRLRLGLGLGLKVGFGVRVSVIGVFFSSQVKYFDSCRITY